MRSRMRLQQQNKRNSKSNRLVVSESTPSAFHTTVRRRLSNRGLGWTDLKVCAIILRRPVFKRNSSMVTSLPVHLQNAGRRSRQGCTYCNVGLQCGLSEDHIVLQESEALEGMQSSRGRALVSHHSLHLAFRLCQRE